ncbi:MAG: phosphoribosylformylglycinamidine synthase I [Patescibacteria group bacterium]
MKKETLKIKKPCVMILSGYGINCEEETKFAFESVGGAADIIHINDLIDDPALFSKYHILAFPGGFSYGDDTGSGKAFANKMKNHLGKELKEFVSRDTLVIGICNGFQIITNLGLLPGALVHNKGGLYIDRWVDLETKENKSPWLSGIEKISLPIAHGEGRYVVGTDEYKAMKKRGDIAFSYTKGEICDYQNLEANPNGAMHDIAGILGYNGRVLGLMPHPERALFFHHRPDWQLRNEVLKRKGKKMEKEGAGIVLFKNAVKYFKK